MKRISDKLRRTHRVKKKELNKNKQTKSTEN